MDVTSFRDFLSSLPPHLSERTWLAASGRAERRRQRVVYWTHHALRCDENPALDVAVLLADRLQLPLLVYQGLSENYRFASDRHHTFILEAARELQSKYEERGIAFAFQLQRAACRIPRLAQLALTSAAIVTEDFPLEATRQWTDRLITSNASAVVLVDTACIVPSRVVGRAYDRAFEYRAATADSYRVRVNQTWPVVEVQPHAEPALPFPSLQLAEASLAQLVSECDIDHSVGPVADTRGGSQAGYDRWQAYRQQGLVEYSKRRNQIEIAGTSRMSAYLHYGMVSPFRIAREAAADGADKYLDELLIWRELAYAFCYYRRDLETDAGLPAWAVATLAQHASDPRTPLSWETLARAKTGSRLWDAAQRSLLKHGELHNNLRMTWGKAILPWSSDHLDALKRLVDLNHRYALDGRDPASYGGVLWCLGQFDRPFRPEQPIYGSVRSRPVADHEKRIDLVAYEAHVDRESRMQKPRIAIIGSGLGGLLCGRILADHGLHVQLFEKSQRVGGRASTRLSENAFQFDHGAQYFTIRDPHLMPYLDSWLADGHVAQWRGQVVAIDLPSQFNALPSTRRFVGVPGMESLARHLSSDLSIQFQCQVARVDPTNEGYRIVAHDDREVGVANIVLWNCPPAQIAGQVPPACPWKPRLGCVKMEPCWAVMVALESRWEVPIDGAFINQGGLSWIARDSSKPGRPTSSDHWVLHSSVDWAKENLETSAEQVIASLLQEAQRIVGTAMPRSTFTRAHRWLYSRPAQSLAETALWDPIGKTGACGDWCGGPRVEGALKSGMALAGKVLGTLHEQTTSLISAHRASC